MTKKKTFIPRNKPKSFVIAHLAVLGGLFIAAPIMLAGSHNDINILEFLGMSLFFLFGWLGIIMLIKYFVGFLNGKYSNLKEQDWKNQPW